MADLSSTRIAVIATDGVEESEILAPIKALKDAGARVEVISPDNKPIQAFQHIDKASSIPAHKPTSALDSLDYDAVVLPGGVVNADKIRMDDSVRQFVRQMASAGKPVAAICHAPWVLISAGVARGVRLTSYYTLEDDLRNAGAKWVDEECVIDRNFVTSRSPADLPAFNRELIRMLTEVPASRPAHA